jgi:sulfur carrier protein
VILHINGSDRDVTDGTTVAVLIESELGSSRGSAVVVDGVVVPRTQWPAYRLRAGQHIELITAVQGG